MQKWLFYQDKRRTMACWHTGTADVRTHTHTHIRTHTRTHATAATTTQCRMLPCTCVRAFNHVHVRATRDTTLHVRAKRDPNEPTCAIYAH